MTAITAQPMMLGNQNATTYGHERAYIQLKTGQPFMGLLQERYLAILADVGLTEDECKAMGVDGHEYIEWARYQAVADAIWMAMLGKAADGDLDGFYNLATHRLNPIANGAEKRRQRIREIKARNDDDSIIDAIGSIKRDNGDNSRSD